MCRFTVHFLLYLARFIIGIRAEKRISFSYEIKQIDRQENVSRFKLTQSKSNSFVFDKWKQAQTKKNRIYSIEIILIGRKKSLPFELRIRRHESDNVAVQNELVRNFYWEKRFSSIPQTNQFSDKLIHYFCAENIEEKQRNEIIPKW